MFPPILDGAMGTELIARFGASVGGPLHRWNQSHPEAVCAVHAAYAEAGARAHTANTFLVAHEADETVAAELAERGVLLARGAGDANGNALPVAVPLAPGALLERYARLALCAQAAGAAWLQLETFSDVEPLARAVRAARDAAPGLPVVALLVFDPETGRTLAGDADAQTAARALTEAGADGIGMNCVPPDDRLAPALAAFAICAAQTGVSLCLRFSAGIPVANGERLRYPWAAQPWAMAAWRVAQQAADAAGGEMAVRISLGGCCGAGPSYIAALQRARSRDVTFLSPSSR